MERNSLDTLDEIARQLDEGLTHFLVPTEITDSSISGRARIALATIAKGTLIAVVGGVIVERPDHYLAMPLGSGIYLHQISDDHKGTVNHSCSPNCQIKGFNRLISKRDIAAGEELTIDYGAVSIGKGSVLIQHCACGSSACRGTIRSDDWSLLDEDDLCAYGQYIKGTTR